MLSALASTIAFTAALYGLFAGQYGDAVWLAALGVMLIAITVADDQEDMP